MERKLIGTAKDVEELFPPQKEEITTFFSSNWSSPESFARHVREMNSSQAWHGSGWEQGEKQWKGTDTMEEALELATKGWKDGMEKAARLTGRILASYPLQRKPVKYGVAGATPNVPRAIGGHPFNMRIHDPTKASKRQIITLLSDSCVPWSVSGDALINRAAVVAAVVDHIEAAGYACDVITYCTTSDYGTHSCRTAIQIKNSNQPTDISRLAFGLGHPAMFRRMIFADWGIDKFNQKLGHGLGHVRAMNPEGLGERKIYVLSPARNKEFKTEVLAEKEGLAKIIEYLQEQKCPAFPRTGPEPVKEEKKIEIDWETDD